MAEKKTKIVDILMRDNTKIQEDRATRIGATLRDAMLALLLKRKAEIRKLENKLASMTDLSASNSSLDVNAVKEINADEFVMEYQRLSESLANKNLLFEIARKTAEDLYGITADMLGA